MYRTRDTLFNFSRPVCFDIDNLVIPCEDLVYTTFSFSLSPYMGMQIVDLYNTVPSCMSRVGGFAFGVYSFTWILIYFYNKFHSDKVAISNMY